VNLKRTNCELSQKNIDDSKTVSEGNHTGVTPLAVQRENRIMAYMRVEIVVERQLLTQVRQCDVVMVANRYPLILTLVYKNINIFTKFEACQGFGK
jgi:hypothetical protein